MTMEKEIRSELHSFLRDGDARRLDFIDRLLSSLLLRRELLLLEKKERAETERLSRLLSRFASYRSWLLKKVRPSGFGGREAVMNRLFPPPARLILLVTHRCQLNCRYCRVRKFSSSMERDVMRKAVKLLFTSRRGDLQLQFFGGEPLLKFDLVREAAEEAVRQNRKHRKDLTFLLTTNGLALTGEKLAFFKKHDFLLECSIDGEIENQLRMRGAKSGADYYAMLKKNLRALFRSGVRHYSISVVTPRNVSGMYRTFRHLVNMGFKKLQMNYSLGVLWPKAAALALFAETEKILRFVNKRKDIEFVNLSSMRREPVVLNAELTVDCDGGIYLESGICLEEDFMSMKRKFLVGNIRKVRDIAPLGSTRFASFYLLSRVYAKANPRFRKIILNNIFLGRKYGSWMKQWTSPSR